MRGETLDGQVDRKRSEGGEREDVGVNRGQEGGEGSKRAWRSVGG